MLDVWRPARLEAPSSTWPKLMRPTDGSAEASEKFVRLLTAAQASIYAYILSLLPDREAARDILQETNVVLWRKHAQYRAGTNFTAWAFNIARHKVLSHRRDTARDRHLFDDALFDRLADRADADADLAAPLIRALEECVDELPPRQSELVRERYAVGGSVQTIAKSRGQSAGAVSVTLSRIRKALAECMDRKIADGGTA